MKVDSSSFGQGGNGRFSGQTGQGQRIMGENTNRNGFRPVSGQILSSDDKSITVKLSDGSRQN